MRLPLTRLAWFAWLALTMATVVCLTVWLPSPWALALLPLLVSWFLVSRRRLKADIPKQTSDGLTLRGRWHKADYLRMVMERLRANGFTITENVTYNSYTFPYVAKKTRFRPEYGGFGEFFLVIAEFAEMDIPSMRGFAEDCFRYAARSKIIPFAFAPFDMTVCFPVALLDCVDVTTAEEVRRRAPLRHWANYNIPVICDLGSGQLHVSEANPLCGHFYLDHFRQVIRQVLTP